MSDFWIGDWVRDRKTRKYGTFEGIKSGKASVKINGNIEHFPLPQLELLSEKEVKIARINLQSQPSHRKKDKNGNESEIFNDELDLHIEKLAPHLLGKQVELILNKQIGATKEFINAAISKRRLTVTIIHGKGTGALKMEIEHLLEDYEEVYFTKTVNNGGAVEVLFRYL